MPSITDAEFVKSGDNHDYDKCEIKIEKIQENDPGTIYNLLFSELDKVK